MSAQSIIFVIVPGLFDCTPNIIMLFYSIIVHFNEVLHINISLTYVCNEEVCPSKFSEFLSVLLNSKAHSAISNNHRKGVFFRCVNKVVDKRSAKWNFSPELSHRPRKNLLHINTFDRNS